MRHNAPNLISIYIFPGVKPPDPRHWVLCPDRRGVRKGGKGRKRAGRGKGEGKEMGRRGKGR